MSGLKLVLFGPPRVELNNAPVDIKRRKALAMLLYLAVSRQPHSRDALATLFYPDYSQSRARAYLRRDLAVLNTSLAGNWLDTDRDTVELKNKFWVDVSRFRDLTAEGQRHDHPAKEICPACVSLFKEAAALYTDDFLAGFTLRDCPEFDDWQFFQAESLRQELATILERLIEGLSDQGEFETAIPYARRWVALDPLHEPAQRRLIRLYDQSGQPAAALRQYEEYVALLEEELGLPPEEETTTLYEAIKAKRMLGAFLKAEDQARAGRKEPAKEAKKAGDRGEADTPAQLPAPAPGQKLEQEIRFCIAPDGARIAYATVGNGPPLVKAANWLSHLEYDWQSPVWRHWLTGLSQSRTLVRYDRRGCGLSDRQVDDFSLEAYVMELETVVDTLGLAHFPLLALSGGGPVAITYAARHPEKISHLILYGSYARGRMYRSQQPEQAEEGQLLLKMMELGWGKTNPAFRHAYTNLFIPEGTAEQISWFSDLQRISTSPEIAVKMSKATYSVNVSDIAPGVTVPTLILHAHDDAVVPFEESRHLAALIPDARFVPLEGKNHILLKDEPAWPRFLAEVNRFIQTEFERPKLPATAKPAPPAAAPSSSTFKRLTSPFGLPAQPTKFIGREEELAAIGRLLVEEPNCRLVTLVGPGGIGKTRLAIEAAANSNSMFLHGAYFVPLASLAVVETIVSAVAEAIGFTFYDERDPQQQLFDYLRRRQILLVIDNFEHLLAGATLVSQMLAAAPRLKILATSRERLNLKSEFVYTLGSLTIPTQDAIENAYHFDAVKLLIQQARLMRPGFEPQPADLSQIIRICRLVQGMPLALVLAAGWFEVLSFKEIAEEIEQSLDFLATELHDVPERQRSIRAVFNTSWRQLTSEEQQAFAKLSIFRGGFTRQAAEVVAQANLRTLRKLVNKSFVSVNQYQRYTIHELLSQFGEESLEEFGEADQTRNAHSLYFLQLLHRREGDLGGHNQPEALNDIEIDLENTRIAWNRAVSHYQMGLIDTSLEGIYQFFRIRGRFREGQELLARTVKQLQAVEPGSDTTSEIILTRLLARQGEFLQLLGQTDEAAKLLGESLDAAGRLDLFREKAFSLRVLGDIDFSHGKLQEAEQLYQQSLRLYQSTASHLEIAYVLGRLGWVATHLNKYEEAIHYYRQSLDIFRDANSQAGAAYVFDKLGINAWYAGQYADAQTYFQEGLTIFKRINDRFGMAMVLGGLGLVALAFGGEKVKEAEALVQESLALCRETGHRVEEANRLFMLGWVICSQAFYEKGQQNYQEALTISKEIGYEHGITVALIGLGEAAYGLRRPQEALNYLFQGLKAAIDSQRNDNILTALTNLAQVLSSQASGRFSTDQSRQTFEILTVVANHPATWQFIKDRASRLLAEVESELPADVFRAASGPEGIKSLDDILTDVLAQEDMLKSILSSAPPLLKQRFLQQEHIATGGMGQVFLGYDTQTGQPVAIKRLKPELLARNPEVAQRFIREGEALSRLNHPNIVKVLTIIEETGHQPMIVMEYVAGGTLGQLLSQQPQLPLEQVLNLGLELADALARVHHLGIIHRDIKPGNVLLAEDGTPRLTDFGVAYLARSDTRLTQEGQILGTTVYMSPEAWRGETLDARSDVWSFGAVLYEMLAGQPPFKAENPAAIMTAILNDPLPDLFQFRPDAPPALVELINQILVKDRNQRIDSMRQVAAGLELIRRSLS